MKPFLVAAIAALVACGGPPDGEDEILNIVLPEPPSSTPSSEELTQDHIREVVNRERGGIQRCYETATRARGHAPSLRVEVDLTIDGTVGVLSATARGEPFGNLHQCIERAVQRWRFPPAAGTTRVSIPFIFHADSSP